GLDDMKSKGYLPVRGRSIIAGRSCSAGFM
ncbi:hypothetical protein J2T22_004274, partial [Pseudarthrobacter defluvii]|nr:hypothetical protein [Pseudarthrobacter defluvii]